MQHTYMVKNAYNRWENMNSGCVDGKVLLNHTVLNTGRRGVGGVD